MFDVHKVEPCFMSCRDTLGNTCFFVSEGAVKVESFCRVGLSVLCMKCLCVVVCRFLGEMWWERSQFCFQAAFALALWLFIRKFFTLSYFSRSRFVHVSDALRFLHVRLFQFRRQ